MISKIMAKEYRAVLWDYPENSPGGGETESTLSYDELPKTEWCATQAEALEEADKLNHAGHQYADFYPRIEEREKPGVKDRFNGLIKRFSFLADLIGRVKYPITGIRLEEKVAAPTGSALNFHSDSGYDYWANVHYFGNAVVHVYVTDAPPKGDPDCELVIYTRFSSSED